MIFFCIYFKTVFLKSRINPWFWDKKNCNQRFLNLLLQLNIHSLCCKMIYPYRSRKVCLQISHQSSPIFPFLSDHNHMNIWKTHTITPPTFLCVLPEALCFPFILCKYITVIPKSIYHIASILSIYFLLFLLFLFYFPSTLFVLSHIFRFFFIQSKNNLFGGILCPRIKFFSSFVSPALPDILLHT